MKKIIYITLFGVGVILVFSTISAMNYIKSNRGITDFVDPEKAVEPIKENVLSPKQQIRATGKKDDHINEPDSIAIQLFQAAWKGGLEEIKLMVEQGQDVHIYQNSYSLLMAACSSNNTELIKFLIAKGANVNDANNSGETALHFVAWKGNLEAVKALVEKGADVNAYYRANGGLTPLLCAAESGSLATVKYLEKHGANSLFRDQETDSSPLRSAAYSGNFEMFRYFADKQPKGYNWSEGLIFAIIARNLEMVKYAVEQKKANIHQSVQYRKLPIHEAAQKSHSGNDNEESRNLAIVKYLISKGAKLSEINNGEIFPWALDNCDEQTIEYFLQKGVTYKPEADLNEYGWTPLAAALDNGNMVIAKYLLGINKDPRFRDLPLVLYFADGLYNSPQIIRFLINHRLNRKYYPEAFLSCARHNDWESAKLLLDAGVDINTKDADGINALFYTTDADLAHELIARGIDTDNEEGLKTVWNNFPVLKTLVESQAEIPISPENRNKGLRKAALLGCEWGVSYFLSRGADVNSSDSAVPQNSHYISGLTALMLNAQQGYSDCGWGNDNQVSPAIAKILINAGADINAKDETNSTALHYLSMGQQCRLMPSPIPMGSRRDRERGAHGDPAMPPNQNHDSILIILLEKGVKLNETDKDGNTPLLTAAKWRNYKALELLIKAGARIEIKNKEGKTLFDYVNDSESLWVIKEAGLIDRIPQKVRDVAFEWFIYDCNRNYKYDPETAKKLIACGANVNYAFNGDKNAMMFVLERFYAGIKKSTVEELMALGTNLKARDREQKTALHYAVEQKEVSPEIVEYLIKKGADIEAKDNSRLTPLTIANVMEKEQHAQILVKAGAKRDVTAEWWFAIYENWYKDDNRMVGKLEDLLDAGVDINTRLTYKIRPGWSSEMPDNGMTALMFLAKKGKIDAVKCLLSRGARLDLKDHDGRTVMSYAADSGKLEMVNLLQEKEMK